MNQPTQLTDGEVDFLWGMVAVIDSDLAGLKILLGRITRTDNADRYDDVSGALQLRLASVSEHDDAHDDVWANESIPPLYRAVTPDGNRAKRVERAMILDNIVHDIVENGIVIVPDVVRLEQDRIDAYLPEDDRAYVRSVGAAQRVFFHNALQLARNARDATEYKNGIALMGTKYGFTPDITLN